MTNKIPVADWLEVLDREYLSGFVGDGGAAVKFAVLDADRAPELIAALKTLCESRNHVFAALDAADIRFHMPQDIFFGLAAQIDWRLLARRRVLALLAGKGYRTEGVDPDGGADFMEAVALANRIEPPTALFELRPLLQEKVLKDPNMARAFRVAMHHLCLLETEAGGAGPYAGQPLLDWIAGVDPRIGNVRSFQIHTGVNRATARHFIESAFYWVRQGGYAGTTLALNNARVLVARNPKDGKRFYTRAMAVDHYELLREFIDDVDRLSGALLAVATGREFVDEEAPRGWSLYSALRTRVMDDVRDRNLANPVAALARLS